MALGWQEFQATPPARASIASSHGIDPTLKLQPVRSLPGQEKAGTQKRAGAKKKTPQTQLAVFPHLPLLLSPDDSKC